MYFKYYYVGFLLYFLGHFEKIDTESITYFSTEHPTISWYDTRYIKNASLKSYRISRDDPRYYVHLFFITKFTMTDTMWMDFYFYQFLTNRYRPSFVEVHMSICDTLKYDPIFGLPMRMALNGRLCPFPPDTYNMENMTIPAVPKGFPFSKGRIYCNVSIQEGSIKKIIGIASIDMEIKVAKQKRNRIKDKGQ